MEFKEIIDAMEQAESYDEMYTLADEIVNPNLHADVVDMIDICKRDGDDLETCWSLVSTVHLDDKIYLNNDEDLTEMEDEESENLDEAKQKTTEKLNSFEKTTFSKKVLDAQTDNELKDIIGEIRYYSEPTYTRCMEIVDGEGTTQYKAGQISDIIYQLNESCNITEKVLTSSNGKFKKGDVYINGQGAMIRITDYTKAGTPQYDIGMPADFTRGTYECRGTNSDESLQSILDNNGYVKVNESKQIKTEDIDYTYINKNPELQEAMEKLYEDLENKINNELGVKLQGEGFGRFNPLYKTADIKINDDNYVTIRLNYSLPDGIYNYINISYTAEKTTNKGAGEIAGLTYTSSSSITEIAYGSYSAYRDDISSDIQQKGDDIESFIQTVKNECNNINIKEESSPEIKEYRYITNHGIGPGTLPEGVFVRAEVLPNFKTAIYTNRPLTDEELKKYDIKPEWIQESKTVETKLEESQASWTDVQENDIQLFMNTWGNYNINGADADSIGGGWMNIDEAEEFYEKHGEEEPFINDVDYSSNLTFTPAVCVGINEYTKVPDIIEDIRTYCNCNDQETLQAIMESESCSVDEAKDILNGGDYYYLSGVSGDEELGKRYIQEVYNNLCGMDYQTIYNNIDFESLRDDLRNDYTFESWICDEEGTDSIDDIDDDTIDEYLEDYADTVIQNAYDADDTATLDTYFDYESFGSDIAMDFTYTTFGAIEIL